MSEGTGMELWERLKVEEFTPEELEEAKNELKNKGLLSVRKVEKAPSYYFRFRGKLARITDYREHRDEDLSPGHATITYKEKNQRIYIEEQVLREEKDRGEAEEIIEKALDLYTKYNENRDEAIQELVKKGLELKTLREMMKMEGEKESGEFDQSIERLVRAGLAEKRIEERERRRCVYFVSEWSEKAEQKTRFFFSPELYSEFLN